MPILTVVEAIRVRDEEQSDREIAVAGHVQHPPFVYCGFEPSPRNPAQLPCTEYKLSDQGRLLIELGTETPIPAWPGPSIELGVDLVDQKLLPSDALVGDPRVVLIGHFHDRRAELCPRDRIEACGRTFVVDRVRERGGARLDLSTLLRTDPHAAASLVWRDEDVDRRLATTSPGLQILSRIAIAGERLGDIEPALGTGGLGLIDRQIVWDVTALEPSGQRRTFLLVDGTNEAYVDDPAAPVRFAPFGVPDLSPPGSPATP
jgi:hypothetical protein